MIAGYLGDGSWLKNPGREAHHTLDQPFLAGGLSNLKCVPACSKIEEELNLATSFQIFVKVPANS